VSAVVAVGLLLLAKHNIDDSNRKACEDIAKITGEIKDCS
jgi:hypothetical protein